MISALDISTSALVAQRIRLDAISSNLANLSSFSRDDAGQVTPYQARHAVFEVDPEKSTAYGAQGVKVSAVETSQTEPDYRYEPNHPYAFKDGPRKGYVPYPSVNMTAEFTDALVATRAYEANIGVMEITKSMGAQTLRILA